jgi:hypothetical protein
MSIPKIITAVAALLCAVSAGAVSIQIQVDRDTVPMGKSVRVDAKATLDDGAPAVGWVLLPYANERRWGAHEFANAQGEATFLLPLPNPGPAEVVVRALPPVPGGQTPAWNPSPSRDYFAGTLLPDGGDRSVPVRIRVTQRAIAAHAPSEQIVGVQWEPWFTPQNAYWQTAQAVPVTGLYDSYRPEIMRQHLLWFMDLGVDFIMPDWSNHIWGKQHWDERPDGTAEIIHATELMLEEMAKMRDEGFPVPKMILMPGLSNGPPAAMEAVNEMLTWCYHHYIRNPRFKDLFLIYEGKPLIVILDCSAVAQKLQVPVDTTYFTVRWMSTQLQKTKHEALGYWTWMDGCLAPVITYHDGAPEVITVTPSYFGDGGWLYPQARGRRGGSTYIESFKPAVEKHPKFMMLHQWNEYAGQPEGGGYGDKHDIYVDSYSVELSDDLEPVSLTAPGYRGDKGGWGFYYLNLTQALVDVYRGAAANDTILAVGKPLKAATVKEGTLAVEWSAIGAQAKSFRVLVDEVVKAESVQGTSASVSLEGLIAGPHTVTVRADGAFTRYRLSETEMDERLATPIPVEVRVPFQYAP